MIDRVAPLRSGRDESGVEWRRMTGYPAKEGCNHMRGAVKGTMESAARHERFGRGGGGGGQGAAEGSGETRARRKP